ncbi:MAG TPA: protoporphyrinogen oxidase [Thermodesulfobacteriota bacterium]
MRIVIIGGGITGLSAAHRLMELSSESETQLEVLLFEGRNKLGGVISTKHAYDFLIEEGPDSFITTKPWALNLCRRLGLGPELIPTNEENRRTYVVKRGRLIYVPDGFLMLAPTRLLSFLTSPLFTWRGKLRTALETVLPSRSSQSDESLASFVTRRFGREVLDLVAQPLISGIYTADPQSLSLKATFPQFLELEQKHGSVIRALIREKNKRNTSKSGESGARYSLFLSLKDGMESLIEKLGSSLPGKSLKLGKTVKRLELSNSVWTLMTEDGTMIDADGVIIALASNKAYHLLEGFDSRLAKELSQIKYESSVVINLAYNLDDISHNLNGFGFVVPTVEKRPILACSFTSLKFTGRAPRGKVLLRCFMGGATNPEIYERDDNWLMKTAHEEMCELLGVSDKPILKMVSRYYQSMPQYFVGHLDLVSKIKERVSKYKSLELAGNAYSGVGIPDCINSGEMAAEKIFNNLKNKHS